jgi:cell division protein ZapA
MGQPNTVTVKILDKEYKVACPEEQEAELVVSAKYLDKQMRSIRDTGKVIGLERIAVMAALNLSHELLQASEQGTPISLDLPEDGGDEAFLGLNKKIDEALYKLRQLEIS